MTITVTHNKNIGNSNEQGPWRDIELATYWYNQGKEHKDPSPKTESWAQKLITTTNGLLILFLIVICLFVFQSYQTQRIMTALNLSDIETTILLPTE